MCRIPKVSGGTGWYPDPPLRLERSLLIFSETVGQTLLSRDRGPPPGPIRGREDEKAADSPTLHHLADIDAEHVH
jgi:hypothetical protein